MEYLPVEGREEDSSVVMRTLSGILAAGLGAVVVVAFLLVPAYRVWIMCLNMACWGTASWGTFALAKAYRELRHSSQLTKNTRIAGAEVHRILHHLAWRMEELFREQVVLQNGGWPRRTPCLPDPGHESYADEVAEARKEENQVLQEAIQRAKNEYWATAHAFAYFGYPVRASWKEYLKPHQKQ